MKASAVGARSVAPKAEMESKLNVERSPLECGLVLAVCVLAAAEEPNEKLEIALPEPAGSNENALLKSAAG